MTHAFLGLFGIPGPVEFVDPADGVHASVALVVLVRPCSWSRVLVALQPADGPHGLDDADRAHLHKVLDRWGSIDSLSYFALRDDRSVIFSPTGKSAITYRVVGAVSLAAGDPLGDPEAWPGAIGAWLDRGPLVRLGAGGAGRQRAGRRGVPPGRPGRPRARRRGDPARRRVLPRRAAACGASGRRCRGASGPGSRVACHRVADLDDATLATVRARADEWRDGEVERGFSMALGRFGERADDQAVVVLCRDGAGELRGLLHFVPWGTDGLSLDLMRRDRESENGIVEQMVAGLMAAVPGLGVRRVSLNFAVFRSVFARGERLGAGPVLRVWRAVLLSASRFWQIESLYRANAKYQPEWVPRFVCFRSSADLPRVSVAALRAEAFLVAPGWVQRFVRS